MSFIPKGGAISKTGAGGSDERFGICAGGERLPTQAVAALLASAPAVVELPSRRVGCSDVRAALQNDLGLFLFSKPGPFGFELLRWNGLAGSHQ